MALSLKNLSEETKKLKKEIRVPDINEYREKALQEIAKYPNASDRKIASILLENLFKDIDNNFSQIQKFFDLPVNRPNDIIDETTEEIDRTVELLKHSYQPFTSLEAETAEKTTEKTEEDLKTHYPISQEVSNIISYLNPTEKITVKIITDKLPEKAKKHYAGKEKFLSKRISHAFSKLVDDGKIEKTGWGTYKKSEKYKNTFTAKAIKVVRNFETGEVFSKLDFYKKLPDEITTIYPSEEHKTDTFLSYVMKKAKEEGLINEFKDRTDKRKKIYKRL